MKDAPTAICEEKERLLREYECASGDYHRAILVMTQRAGVMPKKDYDQIRDFIAATKTTLEKARKALDRHISEHGCQQGAEKNRDRPD